MRRYGLILACTACWLWAAASSTWAAAPPMPGQPAGPTVGWATQADMVFRHVPVVELQYATVLAQDQSGFIWAGNDTGLARWDGYRTKRYVADPRDPSTVPAGSVRAIHPDGAGGLWVGTSVGGIAHYDPHGDRFVAQGSGPTGLQDSNVGAIVDDGNGALWIGTATGLDHFDPATGAVQHATVEADHVDGVNAILRDPDGGLWLGTGQGLMHRAAGSQRFTSVPIGGSADRSTAVFVLCRDHAGRLWIGTQRNGLLVLEPGHAAARTVRMSTGPAAAADGGRINLIVDAGSAGMWVVGLGEGITVVEPDAGWQVRQVRHHAGVPSSLPDDDVTALFVDRQGVIWVSTTLGLSLHNARPDGIWTLLGGKSDDRQINSLQVQAVLSHPDGHVWLSAGNGGGVIILDAQGRRTATLPADASRPRSALPRGMVTCFATAGDGSVMLGTTQGLYRADASGRKVQRIETPQRAAEDPIFAMAYVGDTLWFGGTDGLWTLTRGPTGAPTLTARVAASRLANRRVTALLPGSGDILWVGTETGLNRLHTTSDRVEAVPADASDPNGFAGTYVSSLLTDAQRRLWVGSFGIGLQVLMGDSGDLSVPMRFHRISLAEGLPNTNLDAMIADAKGNVWASTDNGLVVIDPWTLTVRTLGEPQGVAISQYWAGAAARTPSGELLFGGIGGLTVVQPDRKGRSGAPPPVVVTEAKVGGRLIAASQFNGVSAERRITIQPDDPDLSVEFSALDYVTPEQNRYSYRLAGYDRDWNATVAGRRLATYTNLPPGDYTLQLRGTGPEAPWTPTTLELAVRVLPSWYQAAWFRLTVALLCAGTVVGVVQGRTAYLRRRQRELHALVALRTEELLQSQCQLEQIAYCDALTGLANRRRFNEEFRSLVELAVRGTVSLTLLLIDLDRFKHVNDTLGHDAGDALLVEVAGRLLGAVRQGDRVARLGGDEFAVVMPGTEEGGTVERVCGRIIESLGQPFEHDGRFLQVGASIGVAACPRHALNTDALYKCADTALYDAKRAGRNTWRIGNDSEAPSAAVMV